MSKKPKTRPEQVPIPAKPPTEPEPSKSAILLEEPGTETPPPQEPIKPTSAPESAQTEGEQAPSEPAPSAPEQPAAPAEVSLSDVMTVLTELKVLIHDQHEMLLAFQSAKSTRRAPMLPNGGKVQVVDRQTGEVFPSKNGTYQTLLKRGALKELVDKGTFGADPEKNSFGWYALKRAWPDRFQEQPVSKPEGQSGPQKNG